MKVSPKFDVTINITAHAEGYYLYRTLRSVALMRSLAQAEGVRCLIQINLDNPNQITKDIANQFTEDNEHCRVYDNSFGDLSASRNFLIQNTDSKYTLFVDGDDLFTENFISVAYRSAEKYGMPCVVSAEDIVKFDTSIDPLVFRVESTVDNPGIKSALFEMNLFISQNLVTTEIYKKCLYEPNKGNYGYEDWHWNTKVIHAGYEFLVAKETIFFYRQKPADKSLLKKNVNSNTVIRPTPLFVPSDYIKLPHDSYYPPDIATDNKEETKKPDLFRDVRDALIQNIPHENIGYRAVRKGFRLTKRFLGRSNIVHEEVNNVEVDQYELSYELSETKKALWDSVNSIEPIVRMDDELLSRMKIRLYAHRHSLATTYNVFCQQYGSEGFTDVIFVPWINRGGADLAMLDLAAELAANNRKVLIISTTGLDSQWFDKVNEIPGVVFIQSHDDIFRNLDHINIKMFFLRLIQNWKISSMTVMNSAIGFELIERFGHAIRDTGCRIVVHNYAFPVSEGKVIDAFPALTTSLENIDTIVTDSKFHLQEFKDLYGVSLDKVIELPLTIDKDLQRKVGGPTKKILYANRIAREKQPQIAIETAQILKGSGITLDIYGTKDDSFSKEIYFDSLLEQTDNVVFHGVFSSSRELNFDDYDICFMPSLYEGTPRIMLESIQSGLYIVCTDVGGMPESVTSKFSGVVLDSSATPQDFAREIEAYYADSLLQDLKKRRLANKRVLQMHSNENYKKIVGTIYGLAGERF